MRLAAAPVEGAANEALIRFVADLLHVPRRNVRIASGSRSRDKRLQIAGLSPEDLEGRLSALLSADRSLDDPPGR